MYNGIGLTTVRGTATSGHVQVNRSHVRADGRKRQQQRLDRNDGHRNDHNRTSIISTPARERGNIELQKHYQLRNIENKLLLLREELEEQNIDSDVIEASIQLERQSEMEKIQEIAEKDQASEGELNKKGDDELEEGEEIDDTPNQQQSNVIDHNVRTCFNCGQPGHFARECTQPKQQQHRRNDHSISHGDNNTARTARLMMTTNTHIEREQKVQHNAKLAEAFGMQSKPHVEGMAFDQVLQKQIRDEKKAKLLQEEQRQEEISTLEVKKQQKEDAKEQRRLAKDRRKEETKQGQKKKGQEKQGRRQRRRRSPSSSSSNSGSSSGSSSRSYSTSRSSSTSSRSSSSVSLSRGSRRSQQRNDERSIGSSDSNDNRRTSRGRTKNRRRRYSSSGSGSSSESSYSSRRASRRISRSPRRPATTKRPRIVEKEVNKRRRDRSDSVESDVDRRHRKRPNDAEIPERNRIDDRKPKEGYKESDDAHRSDRNVQEKEPPRRNIEVAATKETADSNRDRRRDAVDARNSSHRNDESSSSSRSSSRRSRSYSGSSAASHSTR